jgi:hypothetical protein
MPLVLSPIVLFLRSFPPLFSSPKVHLIGAKTDAAKATNCLLSGLILPEELWHNNV